MFCTRCGVQLNETARFCSDCGNPTARNANNPPSGYPKLSRPREDHKIAGVCAGFARYLGVDVTIIRIVTVVLAVWPPGVGLILYLIAWLVMPSDPLPEPVSHPGETATGRA